VIVSVFAGPHESGDGDGGQLGSSDGPDDVGVGLVGGDEERPPQAVAMMEIPTNNRSGRILKKLSFPMVTDTHSCSP
jgi:hypothetical protein